MAQCRAGAQGPRKNIPHAIMTSQDTLARLAAVLESRKPAQGGDPERSYVARLFARAPDAFLKKIGEEATEVVMAAKDLDCSDSAQARQRLIAEVADLWFHTLVALSHFGLQPSEVVAELERREGQGGLEEKALRKAQARESGLDA